MRSRMVGVCYSGYSAHSALSSAFVATAGRCNKPFPISTNAADGVRELSSAAIAPRTATLLPRRTCCLRVHDSGRSSTSMSSSATSTTDVDMGQDSGEMFDVFLPPSSLCVLTEPPQPAGFTKARGLVHADGDWHRSVHIWLHNSQGELVMQKRSSSKDTFPGMWDVSVGGHFTAGESSLETAIKETNEELGLECDESSLRFVCTVATTATGSTPMHGDFLCNEYKDIYLLRYDGPVADLQFAPSEVEDVKLVHMDQLRDIYASEDDAHIPRPEYYTTPLFQALREAL